MQNKEKYRSLLSSLKKGPKSQRNFPPPAFYILQTLKKLMTKLSRRSHLVSRIVLRSLLNHTWKDALNQVNQVYLLTIQGLLLKIALLFKYLCREFRVRAPSSRSKVAREASRYFSCCLRESKFIPTCTHHPISKRCCCFFQA